MFKEKVTKEENNQERTPHYVFAITRHAERLPSGEISPNGKESAKEKGRKYKESAEVLKAYASNEKSKRTFETGKLISKESEIKSPATGETYAIREVEDIQYEILNPDLKIHLSKAADMINEATLKELGQSTDRDENGKLKVDITKLPNQEKIAPIRAKNQIVGIRELLKNDKVVDRAASCLAHQLVKEFKIAGRYDNFRKKKGEELKKDVILNTVTHGMFMESLLKRAGFFKKDDGSKEPIVDFESEEFGGIIKTNESIYLDIENINNLPKNIPVRFESAHRPKEGTVFINKDKLLELDKEYLEWKAKK